MRRCATPVTAPMNSAKPEGEMPSPRWQSKERDAIGRQSSILRELRDSAAHVRSTISRLWSCEVTNADRQRIKLSRNGISLRSEPPMYMVARPGSPYQSLESIPSSNRIVRIKGRTVKVESHRRDVETGSRSSRAAIVTVRKRWRRAVTDQTRHTSDQFESDAPSLVLLRMASSISRGMFEYPWMISLRRFGDMPRHAVWSMAIDSKTGRGQGYSLIS